MIERYIGLERLMALKTGVGFVIQIVAAHGDGKSCAAFTVIHRINGQRLL